MEGRHRLEITKILAKVMQSSYKRKELGEITKRIMKKVEGMIKVDTSEYEKLKSEYLEIRKEIERCL